MLGGVSIIFQGGGIETGYLSMYVVGETGVISRSLTHKAMKVWNEIL